MATSYHSYFYIMYYINTVIIMVLN